MIRVLHTAELAAPVRAQARALSYDVCDDMTESDWEHSLGGLHALAWDAGELVGHAASCSGGSSTAARHCGPATSRAPGCAQSTGAGDMAPR